MTESPHRVSLVLPTKNGAATLPAVLDAVWRQRASFGLETIAIDSGSTDGTLDLLRGKVNHLISIPPHTFDHGLTRNLGIMQATGELVVLLVQDAVPASEHWLEALTAPLFADAELAGTFARQQPAPNASAIARRCLSKWVASKDSGWTRSLSGPAELDDLLPLQRMEFCAFDNVCSCIRRSVWTEHPFHSSPIAEDLQWAREVLLAGHKLAFVPEAIVVHSHDRSPWYELFRTHALHKRLSELFGIETIPTPPLLARAIASSLVTNLWCERAAPAQWPRAAALSVVWPLAQYLGGRDARAKGRGQRAEERVTGDREKEAALPEPDLYDRPGTILKL
ncbi:MAG: glycosyltransferase family 2 protein [Acidobacteriota bacterium]